MKKFVSCKLIVAALAFSLLAVGQVASQGFGPSQKKIFTKHFQETLFDVSEHAAYSVEVLLDDKEYKIGKEVIGIVIHGVHDEDVKGADLTVVYKNLTTSEKAPGTPRVTDKGNGLYIVSNLNLNREGRWELAITVKKNGIEDRVRFVLPDALKERVPKGRYSP